MARKNPWVLSNLSFWSTFAKCHSTPRTKASVGCRDSKGHRRLHSPLMGPCTLSANRQLDRWPCPAVRSVPHGGSTRSLPSSILPFSLGWADESELLDEAHAKVQVLQRGRQMVSTSKPPPCSFSVFREHCIPPPHPIPISPFPNVRFIFVWSVPVRELVLVKCALRFREFISSFGQRGRKIKGEGQWEENIPYFNPARRLDLSALIIFQYVGTRSWRTSVFRESQSGNKQIWGFPELMGRAAWYRFGLNFLKETLL